MSKCIIKQKGGKKGDFAFFIAISIYTQQHSRKQNIAFGYSAVVPTLFFFHAFTPFLGAWGGKDEGLTKKIRKNIKINKRGGKKGNPRAPGPWRDSRAFFS